MKIYNNFKGKREGKITFWVIARVYSLRRVGFVKSNIKHAYIIENIENITSFRCSLLGSVFLRQIKELANRRNFSGRSRKRQLRGNYPLTPADLFPYFPYAWAMKRNLIIMVIRGGLLYVDGEMVKVPAIVAFKYVRWLCGFLWREGLTHFVGAELCKYFMIDLMGFHNIIYEKVWSNLLAV